MMLRDASRHCHESYGTEQSPDRKLLESSVNSVFFHGRDLYRIASMLVRFGYCPYRRRQGCERQ